MFWPVSGRLLRGICGANRGNMQRPLFRGLFLRGWFNGRDGIALHRELLLSCCIRLTSAVYAPLVVACHFAVLFHLRSACRSRPLIKHSGGNVDLAMRLRGRCVLLRCLCSLAVFSLALLSFVKQTHKPGYYNTSTSCQACANGEYKLAAGNRGCTVCQPGYYCPSSTSAPAPCPPVYCVLF